MMCSQFCDIARGRISRSVSASRLLYKLMSSKALEHLHILLTILLQGYDNDPHRGQYIWMVEGRLLFDSPEQTRLEPRPQTRLRFFWPDARPAKPKLKSHGTSFPMAAKQSSMAGLEVGWCALANCSCHHCNDGERERSR